MSSRSKTSAKTANLLKNWKLKAVLRNRLLKSDLDAKNRSGHNLPHFDQDKELIRLETRRRRDGRHCGAVLGPFRKLGLGRRHRYDKEDC
ncbi:MAG: hypothetical protein O2857_24865 [Planctomycetota bacterium]|nr:hypothetical protein [Planctomycetota bacterium]